MNQEETQDYWKKKSAEIDAKKRDAQKLDFEDVHSAGLASGANASRARAGKTLNAFDQKPKVENPSTGGPVNPNPPPKKGRDIGD